MKQKQTRLDELVSIPVDKKLYSRLLALAHKERRRPAQMGRLLLEEAMDAREVADESRDRVPVSA